MSFVFFVVLPVASTFASDSGFDLSPLDTPIDRGPQRLELVDTPLFAQGNHVLVFRDSRQPAGKQARHQLAHAAYRQRRIAPRVAQHKAADVQACSLPVTFPARPARTSDHIAAPNACAQVLHSRGPPPSPGGQAARYSLRRRTRYRRAAPSRC